MNNLAIALEQGSVSYPRIPELINELKAYEYRPAKAGGGHTFGAPSGYHDDCVMALALALWGCSGPSLAPPTAARVPLLLPSAIGYGEF